MAIFATVAGFDLVVVTVHLESLNDPELRAKQAQEVVDLLERNFPRMPAIIAGDLNSSALPEGASQPDKVPDWFLHPHQYEPMFEVFDSAGFSWRSCNTAQHTRRPLANGWPRPPFKKLDWGLSRDLAVRAFEVIPAVDDCGDPISDHELISFEVSPRRSTSKTQS
ncbi:hypothetical protein [Rhizobium sp. 007]|uniref:hypothetical protein n=1 Tax=Rhizobium sp. 007 TaxID=2785056 RepID=UPI00188E1639|nr:hypothetical protein [Rhizobium sp. 007]QPB24363.1 hypothetical protein ISN39_32975 [Rhizobium sp. 007]